MLLITRRTGEGIVINGEIEIRILDVRGGRVKLGLEYPVGNTVYRQEVFQKIQEENRAAVFSAAPAQVTDAGNPAMADSGQKEKIGTVLASLRKANPNQAPKRKETNPDEPTTPSENGGDHDEQ